METNVKEEKEEVKTKEEYRRESIAEKKRRSTISNRVKSKGKLESKELRKTAKEEVKPKHKRTDSLSSSNSSYDSLEFKE